MHIEEILMKLRICFLIKDDELLEKYDEIMEEKSPIASKKDLIVTLYTLKNIQKLKQSNKGKINTNFHSDKKYRKKAHNCIFLKVILIDSVYRTSKNYYPQVLLEECNFVV